MPLPPEAIEIINNAPISPLAARAQATYLLGAQPEHLEMIEAAGIIVSGRPLGAGAEDPTNPAEVSWEISMRAHLDFLTKHNLPNTAERFMSVVNAAIFIADNDLFQITGEHVPMEVPRLYREHMPRTFGEVALLRAVA